MTRPNAHRGTLGGPTLLGTRSLRGPDSHGPHIRRLQTVGTLSGDLCSRDLDRKETDLRDLESKSRLRGIRILGFQIPGFRIPGS